MIAKALATSAETVELPGGPERVAYTIGEVARMWGCEHMGVYKMIQRGDIPSFRVGSRGEYRVRRDVVEAIMRGESPGDNTGRD